MTYQKNLDNSSRKNKLYAQLQSKEITIEQFMLQCAYWALENIEEYSPLQEPMMPQKMMQYNNMSDEGKRKLGVDFWRDEEVYTYTTGLLQVQNTNRANLWWLKQWLQYIPEDDIVARDKIVAKIKEHSPFDKSLQEKIKPEDFDVLQEKADMFNGEVIL